jgi:hypothetical protein
MSATLTVIQLVTEGKLSETLPFAKSMFPLTYGIPDTWKEAALPKPGL